MLPFIFSFQKKRQNWGVCNVRIWGEGLITFDVRLLTDYCDRRARRPRPLRLIWALTHLFPIDKHRPTTERGNRANETNLGLNLLGPAIWLTLTDWLGRIWLTKYIYNTEEVKVTFKLIWELSRRAHALIRSIFYKPPFYKFGFVQSEKQPSEAVDKGCKWAKFT